VKQRWSRRTRTLSFRRSAATEESGRAVQRGKIPRCARNYTDGLADSDIAALRRALLAWYRRNARDLPWRRTRDPYRIWLAESMLQQTRIDTALPYYRRFVERFPNVRALADARLDDVLRLWAGLGYYTRARNLHKTARIVAREHRGEFPRTATGLQHLPGVGRYTAGAIASMAFGQRAAVVDGNIKRVLTRLLAIEACIEATETTRRLWQLAERLVAPRAPGAFNQALMELGGRVCVSKNPACPRCPLRKWCAAAARGIQGRLPKRGHKKPVPRVQAVAAAFRSNGGYLIVKRPAEGLLGGLWELPSAEVHDGEPHAESLRKHLRDAFGVQVSVGEALGVVRHAFSHRLLELHVYRCHVRGTLAARSERDHVRWVLPRQLEHFAFASVDRKALALVGIGKRQCATGPGRPRSGKPA
jgi:A/G-specific adenine glycosylase